MSNLPSLRKTTASVVLGVVVGSAGHVRAEFVDGDVVKFTAGAGVAYDDNVFRLPSGTSPDARTGSTARGDTIFTFNGGVAVNKDISRQNFVLGADVVQALYVEHNSFNYTLFNFGGVWNWQVGNKFAGTIGYTQNQYPNSFLDVRSFTQNKRTIGIPEVSAGYQFLPDWGLIASYKFVDITNSEEAFRLSNLEQNVYEGAVRYTTRFGNLVDLYYRYTDGTRPIVATPAPLDRDWNQHDFGVNVQRWEFSARSKFSGFLGYTNRSYPLFPQRDFSGPTWNATYIYLPTTATALNLSVFRLIGAFTDVTTNYIVTTGATFKPTWQVTGKIGLGLTASYLNRDYKGDPGILTPGTPGLQKRQDDIYLVGIDATYAILRNVKGTLYYRWQKRNSNIQGFDFDDNIVGAGVEWNF